MKIEGREVLVTVERRSKCNANVKKCSRWVLRILFPKGFNDGTPVYEEEGASPTRKLQEKHCGQFHVTRDRRLPKEQDELKRHVEMLRARSTLQNEGGPRYVRRQNSTTVTDCDEPLAMCKNVQSSKSGGAEIEDGNLQSVLAKHMSQDRDEALGLH